MSIFTNKKSFFTKLFLILLFLACLIGAGVSLKLYMDSRKTIEELQAKVNPTADSGAAEVKSLVEKVSKHMILPAEDPRVVTITDINLLQKDQPFFAKAENGDKILVYSQRVILYNPKLDRIVDVAIINNPAPTPVASASATPGVKLTGTPTPTPTRRPTSTVSPKPTPAP